MWNPFEPEVLTQLLQPEFPQKVAQRERRPPQVVRLVFRRIQVENADVGLVQVGRPRDPDVRRDAVLIDHPEQRSHVADQRMVHGPALLRNFGALQPGGEALR